MFHFYFFHIHIIHKAAKVMSISIIIPGYYCAVKYSAAGIVLCCMSLLSFVAIMQICQKH